MTLNPKVSVEIKAGSDLDKSIHALVKANNELEIGGLDDVHVQRKDDGTIVITQGDWVVLSPEAAIQVAEFILFGKKNTTVTFQHEGVPITAVVLQGEFEKHQLARIEKLKRDQPLRPVSMVERPAPIDVLGNDTWTTVDITGPDGEAF